MTWTNVKLELALRPIQSSETADVHDEVVAAFLAGGPVYLATREPCPVPAGKVVLAAPLNVTLLTSEGPEGPVLLCFTSEAELRRRSPGSHPLLIATESVASIVSDSGYAGVVFNPAGPWAFVPRSEVLTALART